MENTATPVNEEFLKNGEIEWQPLSLTLVEYPKGDLLGKFFAFTSLAPFGIGAGFVTLILFRRDLHTIAFFIGTLINEVLNIILKHIICESRPLVRGHLYNEYGMPSSHAQFVWFFSIYVLYFFIIRLHHINNNSIISTLWRVIIVGSCFTLALIVCVGRVYLHYHTTVQVVVGGIVGFIFATVWFTVVHRILTPFFPQLVSLVMSYGILLWGRAADIQTIFILQKRAIRSIYKLGSRESLCEKCKEIGMLTVSCLQCIYNNIVFNSKVCEMLMIRDTTLIPNVLWFEYTTSRQEARTRGRKMAALKPTQ